MSSKTINAENINVFVRIQPCNTQTSTAVDIINDKQVCIQRASKNFSFEHVFNSTSTQLEVFNTAAVPLIKNCLKGYDCTLMTYGQTGSGKTYTLLGSDDSNKENLGIIQQSCAFIFEHVRCSKKEAVIHISCLDLLNDEFVDALLENKDGQTTPIKIYEDALRKGYMIVEGLKKVAVTNVDEVDAVIKHTQKCIRSHRMFFITVCLRQSTYDGDEYIQNCSLSFFDLSFADSKKDDLSNINMSLFSLRNVVTAIVDKNPYIPFRNSKLTRLLQNSLGGSAMSAVLATISPSAKFLDVTLNTLSFASKMQSIQNYPKINPLIPSNTFINNYTNEIYCLKKNIEATRNNVGIQMSIQTYEKLVEEIKKLKCELARKIVYIRELEEVFDDEKQKLEKQENCLEKAQEKLDQIYSYGRDLCEQYTASMNENEQLQSQLQFIKSDIDHLIANIKLMTAEFIRYLHREENLHDNVASFYDHFQGNKAALWEFKPVFDLGNLIAKEELEQVIKNVNKSLENNIPKLKALDCEIDKFSKAKNVFAELRVFCDDVNKNIDEYYLLECSVGQSDFNENGFEDTCAVLKKINEECMVGLREQVELITNKRCCTSTEILHALKAMKHSATSCTKALETVIEHAQQTLPILEHLQQLQQEACERTSTIIKTSNALDQEYEDDLETILNAFSLLSQNAETNEILVNLEEGELAFAELKEAQEEYFQACKELLEETEAGVDCQLNAVSQDVGRNFETLFDVQSRVTAYHDAMNNTLENSIHTMEEYTRQQEELLNQRKLAFIDCKTGISATEEEERVNLNKIGDVCGIVAANCSAITSLSQDLTEFAEENYVESNMIKPLELQNAYSDIYQLNEAVKKFCGRELQHPTHEGDTPQKLPRNLFVSYELNTDV